MLSKLLSTVVTTTAVFYDSFKLDTFEHMTILLKLSNHAQLQ